MSIVLIRLIRAYQFLVSPLLPPNVCRFYPSCSQYSIDVIRKHGLPKGIWLSAKRVAKCHPFHPGGYDPA